MRYIPTFNTDIEAQIKRNREILLAQEARQQQEELEFITLWDTVFPANYDIDA